MSVNLNPDKALIFRITHVDNLAWILENGLHCRNSGNHDPNFVNIGNADLIKMRNTRRVRCAPGGTLADYVPFYFTPYSIMMYNINTGYGGITPRRNEDIIILVSSLHRLEQLGLTFLFTNGHACTAFTEFFSRLEDLDRVDWDLLRSRDFRHDPDDPGKKERYQAEALIHRHVPVEALLGIGCHDEGVKARLENELAARGLELDVKVTPNWYF